MHGKRYSLVKRPTDSRNRARRADGKKFDGTFYARFKLPDGRWSTAKSTHTSNRAEAEAWAADYLDRGNVVTRERVRLQDMAEQFYRWPDGTYATNRLAAGKRLSERQCHEKAEMIRRSVLPSLGAVRLTEITRATIRDLRNKLFADAMAGGSINKVMFALRAILEDAAERQYIQAVPSFELAADKQERRGILTPEEVRAVFASSWPDNRCYVANLTAAGSGLRSGEVMGLQHKCVYPEYLEVSHSWSPSGLKSTKTDEERFVPIPEKVYRELTALMKANPYGSTPTSFVFWGTAPDRPMDARLATEAFYDAMKAIGISDRKERRVDFHSWRHWYNSFLVNAKVPVHKVRSVVGHATEAMTARYYHPDEYQDVRRLMDEALV